MKTEAAARGKREPRPAQQRVIEKMSSFLISALTGSYLPSLTPLLNFLAEEPFRPCQEDDDNEDVGEYHGKTRHEMRAEGIQFPDKNGAYKSAKQTSDTTDDDDGKNGNDNGIAHPNTYCDQRAGQTPSQTGQG